MSTNNEGLSSEVTAQLLRAATQRQGSGLAVTALVLSVVATLSAGFAIFLQIDSRMGQVAGAAPVAPAAVASAQPAPQPAAPAPAAAPAPTPSPSGGLARGQDVRIAQSDNGSIYAFDPNTEMAYRFDSAQDGPTRIETAALPGDISERLLTGVGAPSGEIDEAAVARQAEEASNFLAAQQQAGDRRRPPINALLSDSQITGTILASLEQAQTILRPGSDGDTDAKIYAFFDPQCPYCHRAFQGLDGEMPIEWVPVSALGPNGDKLQVYIQDAATVGSRAVNGQDVPVGVLAEDAERGERLREIMTETHTPPEAELTEAQELILSENADLFLALSKGAENLRAVPSFFAVRPDGTAVWLQGYDEPTKQLLADITAGEDSRS